MAVPRSSKQYPPKEIPEPVRRSRRLQEQQLRKQDQLRSPSSRKTLEADVSHHKASDLPIADTSYSLLAAPPPQSPVLAIANVKLSGSSRKLGSCRNRPTILIENSPVPAILLAILAPLLTVSFAGSANRVGRRGTQSPTQIWIAD